jgi:Ni,Fe-hydrogenase III small subunit
MGPPLSPRESLGVAERPSPVTIPLARPSSASTDEHAAMYELLKQLVDESLRVTRQRLDEAILRRFGRSLSIRHVDAGSCNGCELEIHMVQTAHYNVEAHGIRFVASPRHADMLLVTGPVSRHMEVALKRTYEATPDPKLVVAIGDCGCTGGIFGESYASRGKVSNVIPVDVAVPGCPPTPLAIMQGILTAITPTARS